MSDLIPQGDAEFDALQRIFTAAVVADPTRFGLAPADAAKLQSLQSPWTTAWPAHQSAEAAAHAAKHGKDVAREACEKGIRETWQKAKTHPLTDADRAALGMKPADHARTTIGAPQTRPVMRVEVQGRARLVVHFADETTPNKRAKPHGVHGCQIFSFVGDVPPPNPATWLYRGLDTRAPYLDEHEPEDAGKTVHYAGRWENAKGEVGPWSDIVSTKVPV